MIGVLALLMSTFAWGIGNALGATSSPGAVYAMTNEATGNHVMVYMRASNGKLTPGKAIPTGGLGSGTFENSANGLILSEQSSNNLNGA